ncbi:protein GET4 [Physcomitrium patens]|uniref:Golgi to ER traffic protein 4 homolog n=1 Tax=Physcomitrium patens TaxID=3218 RepID=A9RVM5_PHYPA|nr:Golgi to ER traffic protein 4 homolog [Physcomitrium patens]PNR45553.1 hypothetical protein PHYPA_015324 [Physcomitrium patens]|eukprot:XP_024388542.1 Golgi to ER traffic protein 4 homolog [Physcomitrella patens]
MVVAASSSGTSKQLEKLEKRVHEGNYYEAQQMYKTIHSRYMHAKKYNEAIELLNSGAVAMLNHGEVTCGTELGVLLIQTFNVAKLPFDSSTLDQIRTIYNAYPRTAGTRQEKSSSNDTSNLGVESSEAAVIAKTRVEGCTSFLRSALKWSIETGGFPRGAPELHDMLGEYIWTESPHPETMKASQHFVRGNQPETFAKVVVECMDKCYPGEADLVVARAVLLYLSLGNLRDANRLWDSVRQRLSDSSQELPDTPLLHFIKFLLLTLERDALPLFKMLRQKYKPSLDRDTSLDEYLDEIGERFFNLQRRSGVQGMLGDFMRMFAMDS